MTIDNATQFGGNFIDNFDFDSGKLAKEFNEQPFMALEEDIAAHQLNDQERDQIDSFRESFRNNSQEETNQFSNQETHDARLQAEYGRLIEGHQPAPVNTPSLGPSSSTADQLMSQADCNIQLEHEGRMDGYASDFKSDVYSTLDLCAEDGRGPTQDHDGPNLEPERDLNPHR